MTYKIGIFGSARKDLPKEIYSLAEETGKEIAKKGCILITGGAEGVSKYAAKGAKSENGITIGISPTANKSEKNKYNVNFEFLDSIVHTGQGYKGRNIISVKNCDAIIIINGGFGTLNEVTIAEGEQKPIIVIKNSGGCAEMLKGIFAKLNPRYKLLSLVKNPKEAIKEALRLIKKTR